MFTIEEVMNNHDEIMATLTEQQIAAISIRDQAKNLTNFNHKSLRSNIERVYRARLKIAD
jgi:hypothetical protein